MLIFNQIIESDPNNADVLFIIGDLKAELNDIDGALLYYQEAYNKNNDLILALEVAAELAYNSNHIDLSNIFIKLLLAVPSYSEFCALRILSKLKSKPPSLATSLTGLSTKLVASPTSATKSSIWDLISSIVPFDAFDFLGALVSIEPTSDKSYVTLEIDTNFLSLIDKDE